MKSPFLTVLMAGAFFSMIPWASADSAAVPQGDDANLSPMQSMVKAEIQKTQADLTKEIGEAKVRITAYEAQKSDAITRAKEQSKLDDQGIKLLKEYEHVLATRYVNKKGDFEPGLELGAADFEALNNLARTHLFAIFLTGRSSAGYAHKAVKAGIKQLEDIYDAHSDPSDGNNPELEIIAKLIRDDEGRVKRAYSLLDELGVKVDQQLLTSIENANAAQTADAAAIQPPAAKKSAKRRPASAKPQSQPQSQKGE